MRRRLVSVLAAALLGGCGGGIVWTLDNDDPPSVSLAVSPTTAAPGQVVRLVAAASDDGFVDGVDFYRIDPDGRTFWLGGDGRGPWEIDTVIPTSAARGSTIWFYARATDDVGQQSDSRLVAVTVQ